MKHTFASTLLLVAVGLGAARAEEGKITVPGLATQPTPAGNNAPASTPAPGAPAAAAPESANPAFTDAQLVEEFGWFVGKRVGLAELELSQAEIDSLLKGIASAAAGKDSPYELEQIGPQMDQFMQRKQGAYLSRLKGKNDQANQEFFAKLKENKNVTELPSGLRYEIVKQGDGPTPKATDNVKVHYTGKLLDDTVFDSSVQRGEPAEFALNEVIPGWTEGIQKLNKGGKIKLYDPPHLAYGYEGRPGIPPSSTLIYEVELLDIKPGTTPAALPAPATK